MSDLIVASRVHQESNDKKVTAETIEQIMLRGVGAEDSKGEKLLKLTGEVVGETTRYRR